MRLSRALNTKQILIRYSGTLFSKSTTMNSATEKIAENLRIVQERIDSAASSIGRDAKSITLVAVSKTKGAEDIMALYDAGHRHFGENYFQELLEKASSLPNDIHWHFIGHLQSSKSAKLIRDIPNLEIVETVDTEKLCLKLNKACLEASRDILDVYIQVHTSDEDTKSGVAPSEVLNLATFIGSNCSRLRIKGLMTSKYILLHEFYCRLFGIIANSYHIMGMYI